MSFAVPLATPTYDQRQLMHAHGNQTTIDEHGLITVDRNNFDTNGNS